MKLYEVIKRNGREKEVKILGFTIFAQTYKCTTNERHQKFLGGLVTTKKLKSVKNDTSQKEIKLLGLPFIKRIEENNYRKYLLFNKVIKKIPLTKEFKKLYFKYIDKKYDDIYILRGNSGEIYLTLSFIIDILIKKNNSKKPLLIATKKYHTDLIEMICPDLNYTYIKDLNLKITGDSFKIDNFRFFILYDAIHFREVELNIKNDTKGEHHYFKSILDKFNIKKEDLNIRKIKISQNIEESMLKKIKKIGLNINNFILIAPEAQSCQLYDENFWKDLINELTKRDIDIFVNLTQKNLNDTKKFKTCDLTYQEAFALAKKAKRIISLRSGFTEFLLQTNVPMDVIYTKFKYRAVFNDMSCQQVIQGFGLRKLPLIDMSKIKEFDTTEISASDCLKQILEKI